MRVTPVPGASGPVDMASPVQPRESARTTGVLPLPPVTVPATKLPLPTNFATPTVAGRGVQP